MFFMFACAVTEITLKHNDQWSRLLPAVSYHFLYQRCGVLAQQITQKRGERLQVMLWGKKNPTTIETKYLVLERLLNRAFKTKQKKKDNPVNISFAPEY